MRYFRASDILGAKVYFKSWRTPFSSWSKLLRRKYRSSENIALSRLLAPGSPKMLWLMFSVEIWEWTYHFEEVRTAKLAVSSHNEQQPLLYISFLLGEVGEVSPCRAVASPPDMSSSAAGLKSQRSVPTTTTTSPSPSTSRIFPCFPNAWVKQFFITCNS